MSTVDLSRYRKRWRLTTDPSYQVETGSSTRRNRDPELWRLQGARGHISPWRDGLLVCCLGPGHSRLAGRMAKEPWVILEESQVGDQEINAAFRPEHIEQAAKYAQLYVRRHLSPEHKAKALAALIRGCRRIRRPPG